MDIQLIPFEELLNEIERRKGDYVMGYIDYDGGRKIVKTQWNGEYVTVSGITAILQHDIIVAPEKEV